MICSRSTKKKILSICKKLTLCAEELELNAYNFTPPVMNTLSGLFSELKLFIETIPNTAASTLLADPEIKRLIPSIRWLRAKYEIRVEKIQAHELLANNDLAAEINRIITMDFVGSSLFEPALSTWMKKSKRRCLVVGSGPLPTTALMLNKAYNLELTCLDRDQESCMISKEICQVVETEYSVQHIVADVYNWLDFSSYDIVFINGLVGVSKEVNGETEKNGILQHIRHNLTHNCLLIMRSGYGLARLFYPEVQPCANDDDFAEIIYPAKLGRSSIVLFDLQAGEGKSSSNRDLVAKPTLIDIEPSAGVLLDYQ